MSDKKANKNKGNDEFSLKREIIEWVVVFQVAIILAVVINLFFLVNAVIPSGSMEPNIHVGDRIFGNRLAYHKVDPERGDIVIFKYPDNEKELFIKRIIGMPGDVVWIKDGLIYINGSDTPLEEPYLAVSMYGSFGPYTVPNDSYFMLGDNRNNSLDSRYWSNPYVSRDKILGKAWVRYWPKPSKISD